MSERKRFLIAAALGAATAAVLAFVAPWQLTVLGAWLVVAVTFIVWTGASIGHLDPTETRERATREDDSRGSTWLLLITASLVSLPGVAFALIAARDADSPLSALLTVAAIATVAASWILVHTVFTLRYADLYFPNPPGGINFPHDDEPDYWEFAYVAFTVGMTFQVSDTDITSRPMRHALLRHALISYLFGAVIVAVTINIVGGLFH